ncbi:hypothetical protein ABZ848_14590 [Streptomyces sp. NPDC047081]
MTVIVVLVATVAVAAGLRALGRRPHQHTDSDRIRQVMRSPHH